MKRRNFLKIFTGTIAAVATGSAVAGKAIEPIIDQVEDLDYLGFMHKETAKELVEMEFVSFDSVRYVEAPAYAGATGSVSQTRNADHIMDELQYNMRGTDFGRSIPNWQHQLNTKLERVTDQKSTRTFHRPVKFSVSEKKKVDIDDCSVLVLGDSLGVFKVS